MRIHVRHEPLFLDPRRRLHVQQAVHHAGDGTLHPDGVVEPRTLDPVLGVEGDEESGVAHDELIAQPHSREVGPVPRVLGQVALGGKHGRRVLLQRLEVLRALGDPRLPLELLGRVFERGVVVCV